MIRRFNYLEQKWDQRKITRKLRHGILVLDFSDSLNDSIIQHVQEPPTFTGRDNLTQQTRQIVTFTHHSVLLEFFNNFLMNIFFHCPDSLSHTCHHVYLFIWGSRIHKFPTWEPIRLYLFRGRSLWGLDYCCVTRIVSLIPCLTFGEAYIYTYVLKGNIPLVRSSLLIMIMIFQLLELQRTCSFFCFFFSCTD